MSGPTEAELDAAAQAVANAFYQMQGGDPSWPEAPKANEGDRALAHAALTAAAGVAGPSLRPGRWWRVLERDGSLWMETSVELEARSEAQAGRTLRRLWVAEGRSEWRSEAW